MTKQYIPPVADEADFDFDAAEYSPGDADFDFDIAVYHILAGFSNIFTAIWADTDASRVNGKMYALSWGPGMALSILNLDGRSLYDHYTQTFAGRAEETLTNTDTRDLNVDTS